MRLLNRIRGPRLSTKLMLLGLTLLIVPWFSYRLLVEMERLLIQGQSHVQLLTAESVSTLFNGRDDLFNDLPVSLEDYESLYAHPLSSPIRIDGRGQDWEALDGSALTFGPVADDGTLGDGAFRLLLGERAGQLHALLRVHDEQRVLRNPEYLRLDNADHVRLSFIRANGEDGRVLITLPGPGVTTAYQMDPDWRFAASGTPENSIQGHMETTEAGYVVEFRLPLSMLGSRRYFGLSFADVDDPETRTVRAITQTLPKAGKESFNLIVLRSPEVLNIIQGLGYSGARIMVIDAQNRVRAETGSYEPPPSAEQEDDWTREVESAFEHLPAVLNGLLLGSPWEEPAPTDADEVFDRVVSSALNGEPIALRRRLKNDKEIIMAAHPIISRGEELGAVVVEQNIDQILTFQRAALEQVILVSVVSLLAVLVALLAFAGRLAWRIRHLRREAAAAIDQHGRMRMNALEREMDAGDEIGELARSVSGMLTRLHQHNQFLENMPRTLRHEINNPLNTLSTSLENLAEDVPPVRSSKYLESAKRGVMRIGAIVQNLADAANLEESLESEELETIDIQKLVENYVVNCRVTHKRSRFVYRGVSRPVYADVADYRIEQMLDKIVDNAVDFQRSNSPIKVQLDTYRDFLQITVANRGPTLPAESRDTLFDSMVSHRGAVPKSRLHFGLGLYVVRVIAEYHGGSVRAMNLTDGSGVAVMVQLPLAQPLQRPGARPEPELKALPN